MPGQAAGAENLCHQAIFMNHSSGAVAPLDAEVVPGRWRQPRWSIPARGHRIL